MLGASRCRLLSLATILILTTLVSPSLQCGLRIDENGMKSQTFLSPRVELVPGLVSNKYFYDIAFPKGHIAVKRFDAEVVDDDGRSVPLHEAYIHHWAIRRYYKPAGDHSSNDPKTYELAMNAGVCDSLPQYFGLGTETRKTDTHVPDPYGIEIGNPPEGYEDAWVLNLHTIDTRGTVDGLRCLECKCELYNVTPVDGFGDPVGSEYTGGIRCCFDGVKCRLKDGYDGDVAKGYYMKYTVTYLDWNPSIVPVKIYILDVSDTLRWRESVKRDHCWFEYEFEACSPAMADEECIHTKSISVNLVSEGDVIYGVAHQHIGGIGSALYGEDGRTICSSLPIYGNGTEAGNEAGYIVGMTACYPQPGSIKIVDGEMLTLVSNYSTRLGHTGVMGMFYMLVAEPLEKSNSMQHAQLEIGEAMNPTDDV